MREIARARTPNGELVLRAVEQDGGSVRYDLMADGVFLMDSTNAESEEQLADFSLEPRRAAGDLCVLVGGLGFGFTARAVLRYPAVSRLAVVELEPALVAWGAGPLEPLLGPVLADPRTEVIVADIRAHLASVCDRYDVILLDVDNGPDLLSHPDNAALYTPAGLASVASALRPGGEVAVWSAEPSPTLAANLDQQFSQVDTVAMRVRGLSAELCYTLYRAGAACSCR